MPVLIGYFALAGLLPFTILLVQTTGSVFRRLSHEPLHVGTIAISFLSVGVVAAIDATFGLLLVRAVLLAVHPPAAP